MGVQRRSPVLLSSTHLDIARGRLSTLGLVSGRASCNQCWVTCSEYAAGRMVDVAVVSDLQQASLTPGGGYSSRGDRLWDPPVASRGGGLGGRTQDGVVRIFLLGQ